MKHLKCLFFGLFLSHLLFAQTIDLTFGENGYLPYAGIISNTELNAGKGENTALQSDGKLVVAISKIAPPSYDLQLYTYRYNANGTPDSSFGVGGVSKIFAGSNSKNQDLVLQPDGKIVVVAETEYCINGVCGAPQFLMVRMHSNGTIDSTFGTNGKILSNDLFNGNGTFAKAIRIKMLPNGKFVIGGRGVAGKPFIAQINSDGSKDNSFATNGIFADTTSWTSLVDIAISPSGEILALQKKYNYLPSMYPDTINLVDIYILKLTSLGALSSNFGTNGRKIYSISNDDDPSSILVGNNNEIIVGGSHQWNNTQSNNLPFSGYGTTNRGFVSYLNADGSLNSLGNFTLDLLTENATFIHEILLLPSNQILFVGKTINFVNGNFREKALIGQLDTNAALDVDFSDDGVLLFDYGLLGSTGFQGTICSINDIDLNTQGDAYLTGTRNPIAGNTFQSLFLLRLTDIPNLLPNYIEASSNDNAENSVFPNPNEGFFTVKANSNGIYRIYSLAGTLIQSGNVIDGFNLMEIHSPCPSGIYFLNITDKQGHTSNSKFVRN